MIGLPAIVLTPLLKVGLAALAVAGAVLAFQWWLAGERAEARQAGRQEVQARWDAQTREQLVQQAETARGNAAETLRRLARQEENQRAQDQELAVERAARARAAGVADRLRQQFAASGGAACAAAGHPAPVGQRPAADPAADMRAHVFGRLDEAAGELAAFAGAARAAGLKCQRDYDAVTGAAP